MGFIYSELKRERKKEKCYMGKKKTEKEKPQVQLLVIGEMLVLSSKVILGAN